MQGSRELKLEGFGVCPAYQSVTRPVYRRGKPGATYPMVEMCPMNELAALRAASPGLRPVLSVCPRRYHWIEQQVLEG